jgi:DNA-directed RNA polymerase specialized sigma24 family protein
MVVKTQQEDFAEFYSSAADECLRTVVVSIGDQDTAQELVDEAFARAWSSWRTVSRHPAPKAWVVRTALNAGISRWRRRRREVSVPDPARAADVPAASGASASQVDPQITAALMRLPARQREVVALRLILDLDTAHVSFSPDSTDAACRTYADPRTESPKQRVASLKTLMSVAWANYDGATMFLAIHPSKLPSGAGLAIIAIKGGGAGLGLVHASQQCTG